MRVREIRELSAEEVSARIDEARKEIVELRFQHALRKLENTAKISQVRKRLARLITIGHEKHLAAKAK